MTMEDSSSADERFAAGDPDVMPPTMPNGDAWPSLPGVVFGLVPGAAPNAMPLLFGAKARARLAFRALQKNKHVEVKTRDGRAYEFDYADLDEVLDATLPALAKDGCDLFHLGPVNDDEGTAYLHCMFTHEAGAFICLTAKLPAVQTPQERGSQVTYMRRYQAQSVLGVAAENDDDGNQASGNDARVAQRQPGQKAGNGSERPAPRREPASPPQKRSAAATKVAEQVKAAGYGPKDEPPPPSDADAPDPARHVEPDADAVAKHNQAAEPTVDTDDDLAELEDSALWGMVRQLSDALGIGDNKPKAAALCLELTGVERGKDLDRKGLEKLVRGMRAKVRALAAESAAS